MKPPVMKMGAGRRPRAEPQLHDRRPLIHLPGAVRVGSAIVASLLVWLMLVLLVRAFLKLAGAV